MGQERLSLGNVKMKGDHGEIPREIGIYRFGRVLDVGWHVGGGVVTADRCGK